MASSKVSPGIPAATYTARLEMTRRALAADGADGLLVGVGADLRWLSGYDAMPLERLTMLVLSRTGTATLLAPRLEAVPAGLAPSVASGAVALMTWEETDDAVALVPPLVTGGSEDKMRPARLLVSDRLPASFVLPLQAAFPDSTFALASAVLRTLRKVKDADEIRLLRAAAHAADRVVLAIAAGRLVGRSEADVAREVRERLTAEGHEHAAFAIVASGPNSASPHHDASERLIDAGDPLVLDIGGSMGGYGSDITRTLWVTGGDERRGPDPAYLALYGTLREAQARATAAVRPGIPAEEIDATARRPIAAAGFGPNFIHRTGHGIGLEEHEDPYLVSGNGEPLEAGDAFSVEPGIYLEGRYGARIEDIVVCGENGPDVLNQAPRDLLVVAGV
jgi:Xaa-Pro aminopeptidase